MTLSFDEACRLLFPRTGGATTWSLGPTRELLHVLGHPDRHFASLHVGGTNGKGSVAVLAYEALRAAGHRVGLYTSPHLVDIRERMLVDGQPIPEAAFASWTERLLPHLDRAGASFFEATTAIAFADFAARDVDLAVVEVGLGGRLDATNVLTPAAAAVTHIALDHADYLGPDLHGIAREKAGIAKAGVPFVVGERDPALADELAAAAAAAGATIRRVAAEASYRGPLALAGPHQRRNAVVAQTLLEALPARWRPSAADVRKGFARARLPGRYDRRGPWLFDVAHNPDAVDVLLASLAAHPPPRPLHAVVGILGDKDWRAMLAALLGAVDALWVTDPPTAPPARRWDLEAVRSAFAGTVRVEPRLDVALAAALAGARTVLVCGSFHTVGDAMARLPGFAPLG
ncbi:MAG TPA: Mur ligase family protein [Gemmatimonadales bacterium]|nr:Mur ligase family protein [Gemmatimonadales bacterium]